MPNYHFNLSDGFRDPDQTGTELPGIQQAKIEAVRHAAEMMKDDPAELWADGKLRVDVTDDDGNALFAVTINVSDCLDS